jgi:hypothetical protein
LVPAIVMVGCPVAGRVSPASSLFTAAPVML